MSKLVRLRNIKRTLSLKPDESTRYEISGRVKSFRVYKKFSFIDLVDGSTDEKLQTIVTRDTLFKPQLGSYLTCIGSLAYSPGKGQHVEFKVDKLKFLGLCNPDEYPLASDDDLKNDFYRRYIHLRPRMPMFASTLRIRSELELSLHLIMKQMDFFRVHTPSLTSNDSEASSDLFIVGRTKLGKLSDESKAEKSARSSEGELQSYDNDQTSDDRRISADRLIRDDYFKKDVFLITSAQLHLESLAASLSRVYTLANAFRAENSVTSRHLCEFMMFEAEEANVDDVEILTNRVESIIKFIAQFLSQVSDYKTDVHELIKVNQHKTVFDKLASSPYVHMTYEEAIACLRNKYQLPLKSGDDIGRKEEKALLKYCDNVPIFIRNYPKDLKPFYMKCDADQAQCFDLIAPLGGEICGGSLREDSLERLRDNLLAHQRRLGSQDKVQETFNKDNNGNSYDSFKWYLETRQFGTFPHGGFGIGVERLLQSLLGISNIRDTLAFPRRSGYCPM